MKYMNYLLAIVFAVTSVGACSEARLTEVDVLDMLDDMKNAVLAQDAEGLMSHFSKDAEITLDLPANMGGKMVVNVEKYKTMLLQAWATPAKFTYAIEDIQVSVDPSGKSATVSDTTIETLEMKGQLVASTRSKETVDIILVNGKPLIITLYGKILE